MATFARFLDAVQGEPDEGAGSTPLAAMIAVAPVEKDVVREGHVREQLSNKEEEEAMRIGRVGNLLKEVKEVVTDQQLAAIAREAARSVPESGAPIDGHLQALAEINQKLEHDPALATAWDEVIQVLAQSAQRGRANVPAAEGEAPSESVGPQPSSEDRTPSDGK